MGRIYLPLQVDFDDDSKVLRLTRYTRPGEARACRDLLVAMWRYCKRERTDGHVPVEVLGKLAYPDSLKVGIRDADRLVECELATRTDTGYFFGSYLKHNKSRAQLEAEAIKKAEAGKKGGEASSLVRKGEAEGKQSATTLLQPSVAKDKDRDRDNNKIGSSVALNRNETLRSVPASDSTPKSNSLCLRHGDEPDENCDGCKRVSKIQDRIADREVEKRRLEAEELARNCALCEGTHFVLDDEKRPTRRKCTNHRRAS